MIAANEAIEDTPAGETCPFREFDTAQEPPQSVFVRFLQDPCAEAYSDWIIRVPSSYALEKSSVQFLVAPRSRTSRSITGDTISKLFKESYWYHSYDSFRHPFWGIINAEYYEKLLSFGHPDKFRVKALPLAANLPTQCAIEEIEEKGARISREALTYLRTETEFLMPLKDSIVRIKNFIQDEDFSGTIDIDTFNDPDTKSGTIIRIILKAPEDMDWDRQMAIWDELSEIISVTLPKGRVRSSVIVSIEPEG